MRNIPFGRPLLGPEERKAVADVLAGDILVHGPLAKQFETDFAKYTKARNAVSVSSCTAGLHLAYFYLGIKPGDEVIVPAQTHTATVHAVELEGGTPVFVDAEKETGNIDIDQIESKITSRTRALSIVHFLGMPVDMDRIMTIARKHNLFVVEDCALAIGTYYKGKHAGLHGDLGCFSFYPVKHMTTSEGGMVLTQNDDIAQKLNRQKAFGVDRTVSERSVPGVYDVTMLGFNYRMSELESALGIEQIKRMDHFLKVRKENYEALSRGLKEISEVSFFKSTHGDFVSSYYCLNMMLNDRLTAKRVDLMNAIKEQGVGVSVYYPRPVPEFTYYKEKYGNRDGAFPIAAWISNSSISLPVGPHLNVEDMRYIVQAVKNAIAKVK